MSKHDKYLRYLTYYGADDRLEVTDEVRERLDHELDIIAKAQFASYFCLVWDLIKFCRKEKIAVGPGRGSVCGSLVTYCLYITDVNPLVWDIPFERFLHLERISMPDIDLDLCKDRRGEVVQYVKDKYGHDAVANIVTYGTIQAKAAVRRACKDLEVEKTITGQFSMRMADELSKLIPDGTGADQTVLVDWIKTDEPEAEAFLEAVSKIGKKYSKALNRKGIDENFLLDTILYLEGRRAHGSVHSAGLVIGSDDLISLGIPLGRRNAKSDPHSDYDMNAAETAGLLKLDILGLRTVTLIDNIVKFINLDRKKGKKLKIKEVPLDDKETYELLNTAKLRGVFQLSKTSIANALKGIRPSEFEDIITILALYRPGPMEQLGAYARRKLGEEKVKYVHDDLKPALEKTYGLIVYQEQVMAIAQIMADYTPGEADIFRKAIGKKIPKLIAEEIAKFTQRAVDKGYEEDTVEEIGRQISFFGRYGFNRGHATGYAYLTYWTAFLKCHYPTEFYAAVFNSYVGDADQIALFGGDALASGIKLLAPNINGSGRDFSPEVGGDIRFGFNGIKGLGAAAVKDIVEYRDSDICLIHTTERVQKTRPVEGSDRIETYAASIRVSKDGPNNPRPFESFFDFCKRLTHVPINAKQAMIAAGCFDEGDLEARAKLWVMAPDINKDAKKKVSQGWELAEDWPSDIEMLQKEKDVLGSYVSHHPLEPYRGLLSMWNIGEGGLFSGLRIGKPIKFAGIIMGIRDHIDKKGNKMAWLTVESDWVGMSELMVFASVWKSCNLEEGNLIIVEGKKTTSVKFGIGFQVEKATAIDPLRIRAQSILLTIPDVDASDISWITENLDGGSARVSILTNAGDSRLALVRTEGSIKPTIHLLEQFQARGWGVRLNCGMNEINSFGIESIRKTDQNFKGRGTKRRATWELPSAKLITKHLGGKVVAEYEIR